MKLFKLVQLCQFINYACDEVEKPKENYPREKPLRGKPSPIRQSTMIREVL